VEIVTLPVPLNTGDNYADHMHALAQGTFDVLPWANEPAMQLPTSMQDHFLGAATDMSIPLYDLYSPFQNGDPWDENLQQDMEDIPLPSFSSSEPFDHTFHNLNSPLTPEVESIPTDSGLKTSSWPLEPTRTPELRNLMPKPPFLPPRTVSDTDNDKAPEGNSSKLCRRRRRLTEEGKKGAALVREIGSCARCIARKLRVSNWMTFFTATFRDIDS
jgi:hypothetical protein